MGEVLIKIDWQQIIYALSDKSQNPQLAILIEDFQYLLNYEAKQANAP